MQTVITNKSTGRKTAAMPALAAIAEVMLVPIELIDTLPQLRKEFNQESIEELAKDIETRGLLQPILLNPTGDRYQVIAGERRLRAIKLNGTTSIPALLVKASANDTMLMQLAENVQREDLSLEEECEAIKTLYDALGSLDEVAKTVKKSKPWCSKRYAMTQKGLHYYANKLLEEGITEDIELLKSLSSLIDVIGWTEGSKWTNQVRNGKAGRNEIRAALKKEKAIAKAELEKARAKQAAQKVSHAKPKKPPPPPPWTIDDAIDDLGQALTYTDADLSALDLLKTWTQEQRGQIAERLKQMAAIGAGEDGFKTIGHLIINGHYGTPYTDIDLLAMIAGHSGKPFDLGNFLANLQVPREKA
ncbi:MAG: ParB/RepB/Spo0J family partition protein [Nitrosomonadales bacterium]|nr:ParB/RepB/Spo0J family partition protein [Nitrosomonadales bacterium]